MRYWFMLIFIAMISCGILARSNPDYCADNSVCTNSQICNMMLHRCQPPGGNADMQAPPPFTLTAITPSVASPAGGITVTLTGTGFGNNMIVLFDGSPATSVVTVSPTQITATVPARAGGCGSTTVTLQDERGMLQNSQLFRFRLGSIMLSAVTAPLILNTARSLIALRANGDMAYDLVTGNPQANSISIMLGTGSLTFGARFDPPAGTTEAEHLLITNLDADQNIDLLAYSPTRPELHILSGNGGGGFSAAGTPFLTTAIDAIAAPFYNHGYSDVMFIDSLSAVGTVHLLKNDGALGFSNDTVVLSTGQPAALVAGDFDKNGTSDYAVIAQATNQLQVYSGNGAGAFTQISPSPYATAATPMLMTASDLNGDGNIDLIIANGNGAVNVAVGQGNGGFVMSTANSIGFANPQAFAATDLDCDGLPELVTYASGNNGFSVYFNTSSGSSVSFGGGVDITSAAVTGVVAIVGAPFNNNNGKNDLTMLATSSGPTATLILYRNDSQ